MINSLTMLSLLKPTVLFVFNWKRLVRLMIFPVSALMTVVVLAAFYPPVYLAETIQLKAEVNFYMLFLVVCVPSLILLSVMLRVQQILFFGEAEETNRLFLPKPDKNLFLYAAMCLKVMFVSFLLAILISFIAISLLQYILPLPERKEMFFFGGIAICFPYLIIRFVLKLPATAAGRSLKWLDAWQMTSRINIMIAMLSALFLIIPVLLLTIFQTMAKNIFSNEQILLFVSNFSVVCSVVLVCILHAAYCGYLFSLVSEKS